MPDRWTMPKGFVNVSFHRSANGYSFDLVTIEAEATQYYSSPIFINLEACLDALKVYMLKKE